MKTGEAGSAVDDELQASCRVGVVSERPKVEYGHVLVLGISSNRRQTLSTLGIVVREVRPDGSKTRVVFRHSEARWHPRDDGSSALAIVRGLEVALERGYVRLLFQSPYYAPRRRRGRHRHRLYDDWEPALRARLDELVAKFAFLHFGPPPKTEKAARALARRARVSPPARPRPDPLLNLDGHLGDEVGLPCEDDWTEDAQEDDAFHINSWDPADIPF